ncbi:SIR2 family protein [Methanobacterium aggregans]|uniref:SIR2 family protein n=1 Tax=Methanobacterium aggregans TaxID=1615586 RepID=UPI001AE14B8F|nr:SIR2 family protein [Methanobacterium aggregans]MBP2045185.1 hypothetical protein [Methanobacterium aggregans]
MDPIIKLAASALPGEKKYILFAGAGVSKDAGIPTTWDLMLKTAGLLYSAENTDTDVNLEEWFINSDYSKMEYSELIGEIYPTYPEQQNFLKGYLESSEVGDAHRSIAELARLGIIRCIITTNFDHYIENALIEKGLEPQVIFTEQDLEDSEPLIHCKSIRVYKPNGTLGKGALKNTPKDLEELSSEMEDELVKIMSEHGLITLGYSGRDPNIQKVFRKATFKHYPLFWVDPNPPIKEMEDILKLKNYIYIQCRGANQFITDYLRIQDTIRNLEPNVISGPTLIDLKNAFTSDTPKAPLYLDYLNDKIKELKRGSPDFDRFVEYDDAIVEQINNGKLISYNFIEAISLACKYGDKESINTIYDFFGNFMNLNRTPKSEGYSFLIYEFFVSFIAQLIKYNQWDLIGEILNKELFVENHFKKYVTFPYISKYIRVLDETRNKRLKSDKLSIMADMICERFTQTELSKLITHKQFMEADYFLFMRTICQDVKNWIPRSCVYLEEEPPSYINRALSQGFLDKLSEASGFADSKDFARKLEATHNKFDELFDFNLESPLYYFDFNQLGSRK